MVERTPVFALSALLTFGLAAAGCSGGGEGEGDATDATDKQDTGVADTGTEDAGSDADSGPPQQYVRPEYKVEDAPTCGDDSPPPRCSEDPYDFGDWGPGSAITKLDLTSKEAGDCCFDINHDGKKDNALSQLLDLLSLGDIDIGTELKENITATDPYSDDLIVLTEHQGLEQIGQNNKFKINFYLGAYANQDATNYLTKKDETCNFNNTDCDTESMTGKSFNVDPRSFDEGTKAQAQIPEAAFPTGNNLEAGPGKVILNITVPEIGAVSLTINGATIEAKVNESESDVSDGGSGVVIEDGKLGGYVELKELLDLITKALGTCECLDLSEGENPLEYPLQGDDSTPDFQPAECERENNTPDNCGLSCTDSVTMKANNACSDADGLCGQAGTICGNLATIGEFADLDTDESGAADSLSVGALFEATGAKIKSISEILVTEDQQVSSGSVTIPELYVNEKRWIVLHADDGGDPGNVIGHSDSPVGPGWEQDVSVSFDSGVTVNDGDTIHAMLHEDTGTKGTYEFTMGGSDDLPLKSGLDNIIVESFEVSK